ncbi:hypothetical protein U1Q18_048969 [Sarracenia purpurea var. burkii]
MERSTATLVSVNPVLESPLEAPKPRGIKALSEAADFTSIPPEYTYSTDPNELAVSEPEDPIPTIDFSLLTSGNPDQRSRVIQELGKACEEWGFFVLVNHGVEESLMNAVMDACEEFFNLSEEEKHEFEGKHVMDPIQCGTGRSILTKEERVFFWRDFLKVIVHPHFHFPNKPIGFREINRGYRGNYRGNKGGRFNPSRGYHRGGYKGRVCVLKLLIILVQIPHLLIILKPSQPLHP